MFTHDGFSVEIEHRTFCAIGIGEKFASVANGKIVIWTKTRHGIKFENGQVDDGYTCPIENAISDTGFPAVFNDEDVLPLVDIERDS